MRPHAAPRRLAPPAATGAPQPVQAVQPRAQPVQPRAQPVVAKPAEPNPNGGSGIGSGESGSPARELVFDGNKVR